MPGNRFPCSEKKVSPPKEKKIKMKKQTIIITGASSGIGKEMARNFLKNGDNVVS